MEQIEKKRGLTASGIKIIAMVCMFIDHAAASVYQGLLYSRIFAAGFPFDEGYNLLDAITTNIHGPLYLLLRAIGRVSFPIYCFFIVEGFKYTHSRWKYLLRLVIFAFISEIPFDMAIFGSFFYVNYQNVYFTLAIGLAMIWMIDVLWEKELKKIYRVLLMIGGSVFGGFNLVVQINKVFGWMLSDAKVNVDKKAFYIGLIIVTIITVGTVMAVLYCTKKESAAHHMSVIMCAAGLACLISDQSAFINVMTDYGALGIITILIMYLLRKRRIVPMVAGTGYLAFMSASEVPALMAIPIIALYNGRRGKYNRYIFYIFYPAHLLLLGLICIILGLKPMG